MAVEGVAAKIADALLTYLGTLSVGSPALPIAMPEVKFNPPSSGKYLEARFLPNRPATRVIAFDGPDQHQGLLQVSVIWPKGQGIIAASEIANEVVKHFRRGTVIAADDLRVRIYETPWESPPLDEPNRMQVPVTVPWQCSAATPA